MLFHGVPACYFMFRPQTSNSLWCGRTRRKKQFESCFELSLKSVRKKENKFRCDWVAMKSRSRNNEIDPNLSKP